MLRTRLFEFLSELSPQSLQTQQKIIRSVLLYLLGRNNATDLREFGRELAITENLYNFKADFLDRNYYTVSQFWRVGFSYWKNLETATADGPVSTDVHRPTLTEALNSVPTIKGRQQRNACRQDFLLVEDNLNITDHRHLFRVARAVKYDTPTDVDLLPMIKKLQRYCGGLAYNKMRFIAQNDSGVTLDDLAHELFEAALFTLRTYDSEFSNRLKLLNTAKVGARNHCMRLIDFHTAQRRSRIVKVASPDGQGFVPTTTSLDIEIGPDSGATLLDVIESGDDSQDVTCAERQWLSQLLASVPAEVGRVVNITLGESDLEFDMWLHDRIGKYSEDLTDAAVARQACKFMHVPMTQVRNILGQVINPQHAVA